MSDNYGKNISALILSVVVSFQQSSCGMHTAAPVYEELRAAIRECSSMLACKRADVPVLCRLGR